jgi:hypothetical protein
MGYATDLWLETERQVALGYKCEEAYQRAVKRLIKDKGEQDENQRRKVDRESEGHTG